MNRYLEIVTQTAPVIAILVGTLRWLDAFRLSTQVELPVPLPVRVLLARYNLLVFSTYIYRAVLAMKTPPGGGGEPGKQRAP